MQQFTFGQRMRYRFDNTMSRGTIALIGWLFLISAIMIVVVSLVVVASGEVPGGQDTPATFTEIAWMSLMRAIDSGTMGGDQGDYLYLAMMLAVTFGGIFTVSTLIGLLSSGMEQRLGELRKGRSVVAEQDHTVVLGWSPQIFTIVSEIANANQSRKKACIAILAEKDKVEMEDEMRAKIPTLGKTRIVCRTGNPSDLDDLKIVNPHDARSIVILPPESSNPDSHVIKTLLALTNNPHRRAGPYHIVSQIDNLKNLQVAQQIAKGEAELVLVGDLIARLMAQTCRQSGLSVVYNDLLDFDGAEIYFADETTLIGRRFDETLMAFEQACVIGIQHADKQVQLNPPMDTRLAAGDKLIVIAEDDSKIALAKVPAYPIANAAIQLTPIHTARPERTLILGWNERASTIIAELDNYVVSGSELLVVADNADADADLAERRSQLHNQTLTFQSGDTTDRTTLDQLNVATYNHIIVLSDMSLEEQEADSRTLMTLLHLRELANQLQHTFSIVSEMLDVRNRELAEVTEADDFIVSDRLISLMLSQIAENKDLAPVFADLFNADGSELYLKPATNYVVVGTPLSFATVIEAAKQRGEVALGYRLRAQVNEAGQSYGVRLNPDKMQSITFAEDDKIIVLAES